MQVETIQMDPRIAGIHYRDYLKQCQEDRYERQQELKKRAAAAGKEFGQIRIEKTRMEREHEDLLKAYRALKQGQRLLNVTKAIRTAGVNKEHMPKLAVANASFEKVQLSIHMYGTEARFESTTWKENRKATMFKMSRNDFPAETWNHEWRAKVSLPPATNYAALVPIIPPNLRPKDLSKYFILWEANWERRAPDPDPLLLSRINSNLFAIVAQWDMTPLELSILEER